MSDARATWLRDTVGLYFDCPLDRWETMLADRQLERTNGAAVDSFLGPSAAGTSLFVYAVDVEEKSEVRTVKQVPNPKYVPPAPPALLPEDGEEGEGEEAEAKDKEAADKEAAEGEGEGEAEPVTAAKPPPTPEPEFLEEVEVSFTIKMMPLIQACLDRMPSEVSEATAVYFVKATSGPVATANVEDNMPDSCEFGMVMGDNLRNLEYAVQDVFTPLLDPQLGHSMSSGTSVAMSLDLESRTRNAVPTSPGGTQAGAGVGAGAGANTASGSVSGDLEKAVVGSTERVKLLPVADSVRTEFRSSLHRFGAQISQALQQVSGEVQLNIPDIIIESPEQAIDDYNTVTALEAALADWTNSITAVVEQENRKEPDSKGPLAEIEFWRQRNAILSTVHEQINMPNVRNMLKVLKMAESNGLPNFVFQYNELGKLYGEAKDNVKFLTTLERHFKNIASGNLTTILDTLPSMMNALRMVWIISRHYNTDDRMVSLMSRIADEIADKVAIKVNVRTLLKQDAARALATIEEGRTVLDSWQSTYRDVRQQIEQSGTDHRWEFERKRLFDTTTYMSTICSNLHYMMTVVDEFNKFFLGPELKAVTDDPRRIDEIVGLVNQLLVSLQNAQYDIFEYRNRQAWSIELSNFKDRVKKIENKTETFIDQAFQRLRSAEGAFELLQRFQHIDSRESIKQQMMNKFQEILAQASKELNVTRELFERCKDSPPVYKNYPPVAGAIAWARSLYYRQKKPILKFRTHEDLLKRPEGEAFKQEYLRFAKAVHKYTQDLYGRWAKDVQQLATDNLRKSILGPALLDRPLSGSELPVPGPHGVSVGVAASAAAAGLAASTGGADVDAARMAPPPYHVNFSPQLSQLMRESKYLDRMGYPIPQTALNVTLQEEDKFHHYVRKLQMMLDRYHALLDQLRPVEANLLMSRLAALRRALRPGFDPLNWNSLHIPTFLENCNKALNEFESVLSQVRKSSAMLEDVVDSIRGTVLIKEEDFGAEPIQVSEFYDRLEKNRVTRLELLVHKYGGIKPIMQQVEGFIAGTDGGDAKELAEFYRYWERRFFNAITTMILTSMATLQALLNVQSRSTVDSVTGRRTKRPPLIKVQVTYNPPEVVITPALADIYKFLGKAVKHTVDSARVFMRWKHGTCIEVEPPQVQDDEEPPDFSFYKDVFQNPHIIKMMLSLNQAIYRVFSIVNKYTGSWRRYDLAYGLWNQKKRAGLEKLAEKAPSCVYFDTRLAAFSRLASTVSQQPVTKDIDFMRVDCLPVAVAVQRQADAWRGDYGRILRNVAFSKMTALVEELQGINEALANDPTDLVELKAVLNMVARVKEIKMDKELELADIQERYRTLATYAITVAEEEMATARKLDALWEETVTNALTKDMRLVAVKDEFREVTKQDVKDFAHAMKVMKKEFLDSGPGAPGTVLDDGVELVKQYTQKLAECRERGSQLANAERLFNLEMTRYSEIGQVQEELDKVKRLYDIYVEHRQFVEVNSNMLWGDLDISALQAGVEEKERRLRKLPAVLKAMSTFHAVSDEIGNFKEGIPLIQSLKNEAMKPRHWDKLMEVTGVKFQMNPKTFTLTKLFEMNLSRFTEEIAEIVNEAMQELKIEKEIKLVEDKWNHTTFEVGKYSKNGEFRGYVLRAADEVKVDLEDNMLNLQTMSGSRFVGIFAEQVRSWERTLNTVADCIDVWFVVQTRWQYLEGIFIGSEDIRQQLPEEARKFTAIDKAWKGIMNAVAKNPNVVQACLADNRLQLLESLSERLDNCQKSLSEYLDTKRNAFPRFFFISDDELLSVLGTSDPTSIQVHLLKLFDNVKSFGFGRGAKVIQSMGSSQGEAFDLRSVSAVEGAVEVWMTDAETEMRTSLHQITKEGVFNYARMERTKWIEAQLGMVTMLGSQIWWTWETEDVFRRVLGGDKYAMKNYAERLTSQLLTLVAKVRLKLPKLQRKKINTLLIVDVHARDIIDKFVRDSILDAREFAWESQLRFYWDRDIDDVQVRQCTGSFGYGYEYMGLNGRLVITPLTDRCYMTLTQALTFHLGGSPAGPAGTGKTETVKDLAKNLALPCFVINCGEGLDYRAMGSIFSGLAQVGAWGCFDEFNRINIEVLSVVSAQLRAIQNALNYNKATVDIGLGTEIRIKGSVGIFVTMNPGYAGRTELPDNLKALFRPVTMIVPDLLQICEIMLFSEGFEGARVLARKMTTLYKLAKEQLSKQYHYDFGMRALKAVLVMAGSLKREFSEMSEELVLMRSLRDSNIPKFVFEDVPLFRGLIEDLFPGLDCPRLAYPTLKTAVEASLEARTMHHDNEDVYQKQVDKVIQLYETMLTRHTTMIVGPTGGGKSVVLDTLKAASLSAFNVSVKTFIMNPKAQSVAELYGNMDPVTRDWTDGMLSKIFRDINQPLPPGRENEVRWVIYDGDVDAVWIENMNSVMDDNRLLTLPNGERIRLQDYCKMIMEVFDLQYASPATISRCGMTYVDPKDLGYRPYWLCWLKKRCGEGRDTEKELLMDLYEKYVHQLIEFVLEGDLGDGEFGDRLQLVIPITNLCMVKQLCNMLDSVLTDEGEVTEHDQLEGVFIFCIIWSIGGALLGHQRPRFEKFLRDVAEIALPSGSLYEHFFDRESRRWALWSTTVPEYAAPEPFEFYKVLVPTVDSVLYTWLLNKQMNIGKPVLLVGESGTAKTVTVQNYLNSKDPEQFTVLNINFSSRTTSWDVQLSIEDQVDKRSGHTYGPPVGKKLIIFVDDLNMPKVDTYGTQQPIALLHFLVGRCHMYDRGKDLDLRSYKDLQYVGAMGPPGGGRNSVDPRFVALFNVFNLTQPSPEVLKHIYGSIITTFAAQFSEDIQKVCANVTDATLSLYNSIIEKLPPTPSKFHYIFNLRDLGRIYEGMCLATSDKIASGAEMVRLWRNECTRIFVDRLITAEDIAVVNGLLRDIIGAAFPSALDVAMADPLLYGDYGQAVARVVEDKEDPQLYEDLRDFGAIRRILDQVLEAYNAENKEMNLVLFEMALEHLTRIHRIIRMPRGNALLVGVGGSGKQSLTKLAAFTAGYSLFEITLSRSYGEAEFREDLKNLYKMLGVGPVVFLFTDAHVLEAGFLELINNMLTTGMVPALYEKDEKDSLCNQVRPEVKRAGIFDTTENCWNFYVNKCRNNLHLVLAMSPSGDTLRRRCRNFPGLVSNTVIDWFFPWPKDALEKVAQHFLRDEPLSDAHRSGVLEHMVLVHRTVVTESSKYALELRRFNYVTPKNYLDFIENFKNQVRTHKKSIDAQVKRLQSGLTKLTEAQSAVDRMSIELKEKKVVVDAKTVDCEAMIKDISEKSELAGRQQEEAQEKQKELEAQAKIIATESAKANEALEEAVPALEAAAQALDNLDKKDITEIKAFANPPPLVMMVCMCVLHLRPTGKEDEKLAWKGCKAMMNDPNFLNCLKTYKKDSISDRQIRKVRHYFREPEFNMERMKVVSKAGSGLLQWVIAIVKYHDVAKNVEPLRNKVAQMEKQQAKSSKELRSITETLAALNADLDRLNAEYSAASTELKGLQEQAMLMERRLASASKLIVGLGSERDRWTIDVGSLNGRKQRLVGDCLLSSSFLSYLGAFTFDYRQDMIYKIWAADVAARELPLTQPFKLEALMTDDATVQQWVYEGLPGDQHSVMNGILTTQASRFPLCIDPQQQAVSWIINKETPNDLKRATLSDGDFMKKLELAIQYGKPFLFEAVDEELDPMIDPILEKNTFMEGQQRMIKLGDKVVEWDSEFRLYLTSKLANPHYSPEVMGKTMIINYSVTMDGLENQLLNVVVGHERPDLEEQFSKLVEEMSQNTQLLVQLENSLLQNLASSQGNILDNEELISTLEITKEKATEISGKLEQAQFTKADINRTRDNYKPAAKRGSILFFAMAGLSNIMKMYEISLSSFVVVFKRSLALSKKDAVLENRLRNVLETMTNNMYDYTCTGIFERHKLMFSFQITIMIMDGEGELNRTELDFFLKGDVSLEGASRAKPYAWVSDQGWKDLLKLPALALGEASPFANVVGDVEKHGAAWKAWYDLETPETSDLPCGYQAALTPFQRLMLYRCFRPDRVYNGVKLFVMARMGEYYVQPPVLDYERIFAQSAPLSPVVFVLSPGADPQADIQNLGIEKGFTNNKFKFLALGQGQAGNAESMLEAGYTRGHWVLLSNCHLLLSWMKNLEAILLNMTKPHPDFRLWLTTDPTDKFPLGILQRALKVVTEPPDGLKLNMRALYARVNEDMLESCPHWAFKPLVYGLCFLHAVVLERRKYGKIGWNVAYDFNESDFNISRRLLALYLTKAHENGDEMIPWGSLKYLIGDAMYGGRVSDDFDRRVLVTYLNEYMGDFLFDDHQHFYFSTVGYEYDVPEWGPLENYREAVEGLPLSNGPAVFGLHPNAEIGYFTNASRQLWVDLIDLQPRSASSGGGISREDFIAGVARDIQAKIPAPDDVINIRKRFVAENDAGGAITPTQVVLLQELERWNSLVARMQSSLVDLSRALVGEIGMSDSLEAVGNALYNGTIPAMWLNLAPNTLKPLGSWMTHFQSRHSQYQLWIEEGEPKVFWLSGLHIPESFLSALVQTTCRRKNWPLDKSTLYTKVTQYTDPDQVPERLLDGCYARGLYLEGAAWDLEASVLRKQDPKVLIVDLPILQIIPIESSKLKLQNTFRTPVYVTQNRRNAMGVGLVFEADLATREHESHWVLQGVALCLNSDS